MILTKKCKVDFEKWYLQWVFNEKTFLSLKFSSKEILENWKSLHESEKYGVLVDFFDNVGIIIDLQPVLDYNENSYVEVLYWLINVIELNVDKKRNYDTNFKTIPEARTKLIEKANEIYNSKEIGIPTE